jgi:hypothetical protein
MPEVFYKVYSILVNRGYHPRQWREAIGVVLRKLNNLKRDYSLLKSYRVIALLNCLAKVAEKIIASRLSYLAEITNLLYPD